MANEKRTANSKPLIQIDDEVREMTDDEFAAYKEQQSNLLTPVSE